MTQIAEEALGNIRTVKSMACEKSEMEKFKLENQKIYDKGIKLALLNT